LAKKCPDNGQNLARPQNVKSHLVIAKRFWSEGLGSNFLNLLKSDCPYSGL
jgi:hypothetical protein